MTLTEKDVAKAALKVIDKRGDDFRYVTTVAGECLYSEDLGVTGSCIFGAALIEELGATYHRNWENRDVSSLLDPECDTEIDIEIEIESWRNMTYLQAAQVRQDQGDTYGSLRGLLEEVANS